MKFTYPQAIIAIFAIGVLMLLMRAFPFIIFAKKQPPKFFKFIEKYIPTISIAVLCIVCLKEKTTDLVINQQTPDLMQMVPALSGALLTVILHLWKKNSMFSIFGGTILFMVLTHIM